MSDKILDGKLLPTKLIEALAGEVSACKSQTAGNVRLVNVIVGEDHGACAYANSQKRIALQVGIEPAQVTITHRNGRPTPIGTDGKAIGELAARS